MRTTQLPSTADVTSPMATLTALTVFLYASPVLTIAYFVCAKILAACFLHKAPKRASRSHRRILSIGLLATVTIGFVAQALTYAVQAVNSPDYEVGQAWVIYAVGGIATFVSLTLGLLESKKPLWHPYFGTWSVSLVTETIVFALSVTTTPTLNDDFALARVCLHILRIACLLILCISGISFVLSDRKEQHRPDEAESLLGRTGAQGSESVNDATSDPVARANVSRSGYGAIPQEESLCAEESSTNGKDDDDEDDDLGFDSDSEDPELDKQTRAEQKRRLEESGSWLNYLKDYKVFIPIIWPAHNRFLQACMAVVGVVILVERALAFLIPNQLGVITNELASGDLHGGLPWKALGLWAFFSWLRTQAGLDLIQSMAQLPIQQWTYKSIGVSAFAHVMNLSMDFHSGKSSGELIRAIEQGQNLRQLLEFLAFELAPMFMDLIIALVYVSYLFDIYIALVLMVVGGVYVWIGAKTTAWSIARRRRLNTAWRNESKVQNEGITNWLTVSHFNRGQFECEKYGDSVDEFNLAELYYIWSYYLGGASQVLVMLAGRFTAYGLAGYQVSQGKASIGSFVALTAYWSSIESPLTQLSWSVRRVSGMLTDSERLLQLLLTKPSIKDQEGAVDIVIEKGEVEFDNVGFSYDVRRSTLKGVSFMAKSGQTIAFVGETGGGKSTILKLLYRYHDVNSGSIKIDGQDIRGVTLDSLRDSFGMVPQDPALFNDTIMTNIKYARLDATDDEVREACKAAAIHDKIETFPDKYKSIVGERGVKLSGGEMQRVAIARAILRQPKLVLLDEATSAIDTETESHIQAALKKLTNGRTTFVIAHRLSTIQHADLILVINDGEIIERGTHDELLGLDGKYTALWSRQLSKASTTLDPKLVSSSSDGDALIDLDEESSSKPRGGGDED